MNAINVIDKRPDNGKFEDYAVYFLEMEDRSVWVWKPDIGGITVLKEVIAYRVSKWLGLNIVPETVEFKYEGVPGSAQRFIEGRLGSEVYQENEHPSFLSSQRLGLLDLILNNNDRWHSNVIIDSENQIWAIDNGGILQPRDAWSASAWAITGKTLEPAIFEIAKYARTNIVDLVKMVFGISVIGVDGEVSALSLWIGVNIMCEKIASLAPAVGYNQRAFDTWGSIEFGDIAEAAGYPEESCRPL